MHRVELDKLTQENQQLLGAIARPMFTDVLPQFLSTVHLGKMRQVCKFFKDNEAFNAVINRLSSRWEVFVKGDKYYFLSGKGHAYELNGLAYIAPKPIYLENKKPIVNIISGYSIAFYQDIDGDYHVNGVNSCGQMGLDPESSSSVVESPLPLILPNKAKIKRIVPGHTHTFACDVSGNWFVFGNASEGETGIPLTDLEVERYKEVQNRVCRPTPILVTLPNGKPIVEVVAASSVSYFKDADGQWFGCGYNGGGMLGAIKTRNQRDAFGVSNHPLPVPLSLPNGQKICDVIAGGRHVFFKDESDNYYGCGENDHGELALGRENHYTRMDRVKEPTLINFNNKHKIVDIVAGYSTTFFKLSDGHWYACGQNYNNQLTFRGKYSNVSQPQRISLSNNKPIAKIIAGSGPTVILDVDGNWHSYGKTGHENVVRALDMALDPQNPNLLNFDRFEDSVQELLNQRGKSIRLA